jgi:predicted RNase H-like HicB family nuclease
MMKTYTANYTKILSGYMGQLVEWPEVITEGKNLDDCRRLLQDALHEMIVAYRRQRKEIPVVKRHRLLDRITANQLCKQAGLQPKY